MNINYFVTKFSNIPEEYIGMSTDNTDAWEWCDKAEQEELYRIVKPYGILLCVNDGEDEYAWYGATPKDRILGFLEYIRENKSPYLRY